MGGRLIATAGLLALLAGCATGRDEAWQPEFAGRTLRVQASNGQVTLLDMRRSGRVLARFGERETRGLWSLERDRLCFDWTRDFRECWPHARPFRPGRTETIRSDKGNVVRVTLQ